MSWLRRRKAVGARGNFLPDAAREEVAVLRDRATLVGAQAAQQGNKLSHLGARIAALDDELGMAPAGEHRDELEERRAALDLELTSLARRVDAMLEERESLLGKLAELEERYGFPASRFHIVSDGMADDAARAELQSRAHRRRRWHEQREQGSA